MSRLQATHDRLKLFANTGRKFIVSFKPADSHTVTVVRFIRWFPSRSAPSYNYTAVGLI